MGGGESGWVEERGELFNEGVPEEGNDGFEFSA